MIFAQLPDERLHRLPFYLAMEEHLARTRDCDRGYFFMWRVDPTVICGRNQRMESEVDMDYCRREGIEVYRRKSGGGCVMADRNNVMFSYVTASDDVTGTFAQYTQSVAGMLRSLGLDASATSRNDILIGDRKVSGNAFYHLPGRSIVHGTMLYDFDAARMAKALTPSRAKLQSKGVQSAPMRVTSLSEHLDMSLDEFIEYARRFLADSTEMMNDEDMAAIERIEAGYLRPEWLADKASTAVDTTSVERHCRIEGIGEFDVHVALTPDGIIDGIDMTGDFFPVADMDSLLFTPLMGVRYSHNEVSEAIASLTDPRKVVSGLTRDLYMSLLIAPEQTLY